MTCRSTITAARETPATRMPSDVTAKATGRTCAIPPPQLPAKTRLTDRRQQTRSKPATTLDHQRHDP
jgi:hypothetical protein